MKKIERILDFWFGAISADGFSPKAQGKLWFGFNPQTDELIKREFQQDVENAKALRYQDWENSALGRLALIILLDQFPRNIYRGTAQAFTYDTQALKLCLHGLPLGHDTELLPIHRAFYYMPLEHSESADHQALCVKSMLAMQDELDSGSAAKIAGFVEFAKIHQEVITRFGRFPHRNQVLERESSAEEKIYLEQESSGFGQN